jgi:farnesyl-diphosphate farnesyltransferase
VFFVVKPNKNPETDEQFQQRLLQGVARTFALTIPRLPPALADVVANAYLLCRITDTIEDETALTLKQKRALFRHFIDVVAARRPAENFAETFYPLLSKKRLPAERELVRETPRVIRISHGFNPRQRAALEKCVTIMAEGMAYYQSIASLDGLVDQTQFDNYCYHVAGIVGDMLTDLCCDYSPAMDARKTELHSLALSFGQGLQMINILKDINEDRQRGVCWLPRNLFPAGFNPGNRDAGLETLIAINRAHLHNALRYTRLIPKHETGLRTFCLWAIGMAALTLRKINRRRDFTVGTQVKISRQSVFAVITLTRLLRSSNRALNVVFRLAMLGLPSPGNATVSDSHAQIREWCKGASNYAKSEN